MPQSAESEDGVQGVLSGISIQIEIEMNKYTATPWIGNRLVHWAVPYLLYQYQAFKSVYQKNVFLISQPKHMLWVLKRTVSMRRFFWAPKTYVQADVLENI